MRGGERSAMRHTRTQNMRHRKRRAARWHVLPSRRQRKTMIHARLLFCCRRCALSLPPTPADASRASAAPRCRLRLIFTSILRDTIERCSCHEARRRRAVTVPRCCCLRVLPPFFSARLFHADVCPRLSHASGECRGSADMSTKRHDDVPRLFAMAGDGGENNGGARVRCRW